VDALSDHSLFEVQTSAGGRGDEAVTMVLPLRPTCAVRAQRGAGGFLRPRFKALHSVTLFSATLSPPDYAIQLLGLPENTAWIDVPPAFAAEHLTVRVADGVSDALRRTAAARCSGWWA
jgi:DNA excision repair protein ERCC-2